MYEAHHSKQILLAPLISKKRFTGFKTYSALPDKEMFPSESINAFEDCTARRIENALNCPPHIEFVQLDALFCVLQKDYTSCRDEFGFAIAGIVWCLLNGSTEVKQQMLRALKTSFFGSNTVLIEELLALDREGIAAFVGDFMC